MNPDFDCVRFDDGIISERLTVVELRVGIMLTVLLKVFGRNTSMT